jgi:hypothetical protein
MSMHMLHRAGDARSLPMPAPGLYRDDATPDVEFPAAAVLMLAAPQRQTRWERWWGHGPRRSQDVHRVLYLHRRAFEAELAGHHASADFFWREAIAALRATWRAEAAWAAVASKVHADGNSLRKAVATELFVDAHIAFANGSLQPGAPAPESRAFAHAAFIGQLLDLPGLELDFATTLLPAIVAEAEALKAAGRASAAIDRLRRERRTPSTPILSDMLASLLFARTLAALADDPEGRELADARRIARGIRDLEMLCEAHPENVLVYDLLAQLHHLHSIRLNNGGRVSEAILASAKAAAFRPGFEAAEEAMKQLVENMQQVQVHAARVQAQLRGSYNKQLSAQGAALVRDASQGLKPMQAFQASGDPQRIARRRSLADAARLWRDLAGGSATRPPAAQLLRLRDTVLALRDAPACDDTVIAQAIAADPSLPPLELQALARSVRGLRGEATEHDIAPALLAAQAIAPVPSTRERGGTLDGLGHWLFGRQDVGTKAFAATAGAILVATITVSAIDLPNQHARDAALAQIRASDPARDYERVIAASERFLAEDNSLWKDPRKDEVLDAYAQALTSWFAEVRAAGDAPTLQRVARYRALTQGGELR